MHPQKKLKAATEVGPTLSIQLNKIKNKLHTKSVIPSINKLDRLICRNNSKYKLTSLDLINQTAKNNGTPVTLASVYDPLNQIKKLKRIY